jgi:hypothetical protein
VGAHFREGLKRSGCIYYLFYKPTTSLLLLAIFYIKFNLKKKGKVYISKLGGKRSCKRENTGGK